MASTIGTFSRLIDTAFTQTWQEMQSDAADQITESHVVWALLKMKGCFKTQTGGNTIERTIRYAIGDSVAIEKGDVLPQGEFETHTAAYWGFRNIATSVQRSLLDDIANRGKFRIRDYVSDRMDAAMEGLKAAYDTDIMGTNNTAETGKRMQSINDIVPPFTDRATGTYGKIDRSNTWWQPRYKQLQLPYEVNLVENMQEFFNTVSNNQEDPDIILTDKGLYEMYERYGLDATQLVGNSKMLDLGFTTLKFKGAELTWSPTVTTNNMLFLNSKYIELVYDPALWFDMTEWKTIPLQLERIAHILCRCNLISKSLRRHGRLYP